MPPINEITFKDAQKLSIKCHAWATGLNAGSLAVGIFLVFIGGFLDERLVWIGIGLVVIGIVAFLGFEWFATRYDLRAVEATPAETGSPIGGTSGEALPRPRRLTFEHDYVKVLYDDDLPRAAPSGDLDRRAAV